MALVGLEGRAFVALLSSFACAIPGIMATRTMPSARERLATMLSLPLVTCSARWPVYLLLVSTPIPADTRWWGVGARGIVVRPLPARCGLDDGGRPGGDPGRSGAVPPGAVHARDAALPVAVGAVDDLRGVASGQGLPGARSAP